MNTAVYVLENRVLRVQKDLSRAVRLTEIDIYLTVGSRREVLNEAVVAVELNEAITLRHAPEVYRLVQCQRAPGVEAVPEIDA